MASVSKSRTLKQFLESVPNEFVEEFQTLCAKYKISNLLEGTDDERKKKRKYPESFEDLTQEHIAELAKVGFNRISRRRRTAHKGNVDSSESANASDDNTTEK